MEILNNIYNTIIWVSNLEYFGAIIMGVMLIIIIASIILPIFVDSKSEHSTCNVIFLGLTKILSNKPLFTCL
jgi:hypothetical protein